MTDLRRLRFRVRKLPNPYLKDDTETPIPPPTMDDPLVDGVPHTYNAEKTAWLEMRKAALERDGYRCGRCGASSPPYYVHHIRARKDGGEDELSNLETLCKACHVQTDSYGRNRTG